MTADIGSRFCCQVTNETQVVSHVLKFTVTSESGTRTPQNLRDELERLILGDSKIHSLANQTLHFSVVELAQLGYT